MTYSEKKNRLNSCVIFPRRRRAMQLRRTSSMGHLGRLFLLLAPLTWCYILGAAGHSLPACREQLEFRCSDGSCILRLSVCDGHTDCEDGSDELHCSHLRCKKNEFACHSRRCISTHLRCNGMDDCGDGSDEASCQNCTAAGFFSCGLSDTCLPRNKLCDGRADCKDGRDESQELCGLSQPSLQTSPACKASEFHCGDGQCIRQTWRCDNSRDCSDGRDEDNCDQDECKVNNGGCSHLCLDQPMGFHCGCPDSMKLVGDSQCEEIDTCLESDVCDQLCVHVNNSLTCDCHKDYQMNPTTGECKAKGDEAQLVFTSSKGMHWISMTGTKYKEMVPHLPGPGPVAALAFDRTLYWAKQGSIYRVSTDGEPQNSLVLKVQGSLSGLAVDWIHQLLYWTSEESSSVNVGLLDGSTWRQLITGLEKPSAVAVDPLQGLLFWAQCGNSPKIERSSLVGRDRRALVTSLIRHPVALSLDMPRQLLYWVDRGMRIIFRVNLDGHHRKAVVESNGYLDRPFGLAVFEGFVYWSEEATRSICRASKHNGGNFQVLLSNVTSPGGVVVVQPVLQPNGPSVCGHTGAVCQHKCVINLLSSSPEFSCTPPEKGQNRSQEIPSISRTVPVSTLSDPTFAGILSLTMFLSVLLVGMALWWWREEFMTSRSLTEQSFSLKESQDLLIIQEPHTRPNACLVKETLLKLDLEGE
ncbi:low-density lipoprotein receptor-related protein 8-like [Plectropomus leopardus]|uniref:low-density lipoprotein receptor-related protein 8-like n=1 Tax=Plectropomus leopardus TaxID=160734 RepID=UPI001C4C5CD0|nr:low-density lipoprotein receptor-related protein 8-like [Plectropomus leopardus]